MYYHSLKGKCRGDLNCSLPSVPNSSSLFSRDWPLQPLPKTSSLSSTFISPHHNQDYECSLFILLLIPCLDVVLNLLLSTMYFLWHSGYSCPNLYCCCHCLVTSVLSARNDCSYSCPLNVVRKHYGTVNTKYITV